MLTVRLTHRNLPDRVYETRAISVKIVLNHASFPNGVTLCHDSELQDPICHVYDGTAGMYFFTHNPETGEEKEYSDIQIVNSLLT